MNYLLSVQVPNDGTWFLVFQSSGVASAFPWVEKIVLSFQSISKDEMPVYICGGRMLREKGQTNIRQ